MSYTSDLRINVGSPVHEGDLLDLKANNDYLTNKFKFRAALLGISANVAIANGATQIISWNLVDFDTDSLWSAINPSRLTILKSGSMVARVVAGVSLSQRGRFDIRMKYNGGNNQFLPRYDAEFLAINLESPLMGISGSDYFELSVKNASGSDVNVTTANTFFGLEVICPF